jgi:hypothetical protein
MLAILSLGPLLYLQFPKSIEGLCLFQSCIFGILLVGYVPDPEKPGWMKNMTKKNIYKNIKAGSTKTPRTCTADIIDSRSINQ